MALKRYVGPFDQVELKVAGNEIGIVDHGGQIVVPDDLAALVAWGADWEEGSTASDKPAAIASGKDAK